jgi:hypothetical protein
LLKINLGEFLRNAASGSFDSLIMHFVSGATSLNLLPLTLPSYFFCHLSSAFSSRVLRFSLSRLSPGSSVFSFSHGGFLLRMTAGGLSEKGFSQEFFSYKWRQLGP